MAIGLSIGVNRGSSDTMKENMNKRYLTRIIDSVRFYFGLIESIKHCKGFGFSFHKSLGLSLVKVCVVKFLFE